MADSWVSKPWSELAFKSPARAARPPPPPKGTMSMADALAIAAAQELRAFVHALGSAAPRSALYTDSRHRKPSL